MYIRKKNNENSRIKRPAKRSKSCDMFFSSGYGYYLKPIVIFSALLTIDFLMEIRVEYLWSCWLLMKSVTDSYKYQGLVFSLFFMLIVMTSDIICYIMIPVTWLFFIASSYVWVQLVGHTERGICLPTVIICLVFFYTEYILRLRGFSHVSLSMSLCRPFASNSIGYPVVTMGFGLKSYIAYKLRMRKQRDVEAKNRFVYEIVDKALPEDNKRYRVSTEEAENESSSIGDDSVEDSSLECPPHPSCPLPSVNLISTSITNNNSKMTSTPPISNGKLENSHSSSLCTVKSQSGSIDYVNQWDLTTQQKPSLSNGHIKQPKAALANGGCISEVSSACTMPQTQIRKNYTCTKSNKEDISKCDLDLRKLKTDLQTSRITDADLRAQLTQAIQVQNSVKMELNQCRQDLLTVQNKFQSLQQKYQNEKQNNQSLEKKFNEEKKNCQLFAQQLAAEKKARKEESEIKSKALQSATLAAAKPSECTESCKSKRRQLDIELKSLKKEKQSRDDQIRTMEQQLSELPKLRKLFDDYQHMSNSITNLREEKEHLVRTLSDENKIKQNLITAYHSSLKEVNALNEQLTQKDYQILQLNINGVPDYLGGSQQSHFQESGGFYPTSSGGNGQTLYNSGMMSVCGLPLSSGNGSNGGNHEVTSSSSSMSSCLIGGYNSNNNNNNINNNNNNNNNIVINGEKKGESQLPIGQW